MNVIALTAFDLALAGLLVVVLGAMTVWQSLCVARSLAIASVRTVLQLLLVGLVLQWIFDVDHVALVASMSVFMLAVAGYEVMARQNKRFRGLWGYGLGTVTMFVSSFTVALLALTTMVGPEPWWTPQYAIPLLGMILGNTMTGIALALDRLTSAVARERRVIEARLALGHVPHVALATLRREAARAGLMPTINAMATAGIVSLPGMMTGQILAGTPPMIAVSYQILIMFLIAAGTGFGALAALSLASRRLFDTRQRLRLDRLA
ncbi:MAG: ABC transporter permease [Thioalkalivibrionaceae bacterium]